MEDQIFSFEAEGLTYEGDASVPELGVSCIIRADRALPRRLLSFSGFPFAVSSLVPDPRASYPVDFALHSLLIPSSVVSICEASFTSRRALSLVVFESGSQLSAIGDSTFRNCTALISICVPSSVQTLGAASFFHCIDLSNVGFERHSSLSVIPRHAFGLCFRLSSICLPAALERLGPDAFAWYSMNYVAIHTGNLHFSISGSYLLDFEGVSIVAHQGMATELRIGNAIEELADCCFSSQGHLSALTFEPGSRLRRIGAKALSHSALADIVIPASVQILGRECFFGCSELVVVRFEPNSRLAVIEPRAFAFCYCLETVWIPSFLQAIAAGHFGYCPRVAIVVLETGAIVRPTEASSHLNIERSNT